MTQAIVSNNSDLNRYEAHIDGELAGIADYELGEGVITFGHTEVDSAYEGQGVGSALVRFALDDVRAIGGLRVRPFCPFVKAWITNHPDYADLTR